MTMGGTGPFRLGSRDREAADTTTSPGTSQASRLDAVPFAVDHREVDGDIGLVTVEGELDLSSAPNLKWALADTLGAGVRQIVVDLSRVTFIDSTALGVLVGVRRTLGPGGRIAIAGSDADVMNIFELTGLDATFDMFASAEEALAWIRGRGAAAG
jgi:anti-sigma B factor antagonist